MEGAELLPPAGRVSGEPRQGKPLRALATAGNAAALILLVLVLARRETLFGSAPPRPPRQPSPTVRAASAERVLLVVIDGLRDDRVRRMPHLAALARQGGRGTARVESLVPSTVAGIRALAEGVVPPPASFTEDFGASTTGRGGIFEVAAAAGRTSFAAGPRLWADLYGPWLAGAASVETVRGDDPRVLQAALGALRRHDLVVAHFGSPDDAAHLVGLGSGVYSAALARCDAALGELLRRAPPGTAVVVTSDHGVSDRGGHAGPEPAVLTVPVVLHGPGFPSGELEPLRQRDLHRLILRPLGLTLPVPPEAPAPHAPWWAGLLALLALAAGMSTWSAVASGNEPARAGFVLNVGLWLALALAFVAPWGAMGFAALVLAGVAVWPRGGRRGQGIRALLLAGAAFAALRWLDADLSLSAPLALPAPTLQIATLFVGILAGLSFLQAPGWLQGFGAVVVPVLLARLFLGETVSLSTLDVREAFRLVDGPLGLPGAAAAALLRQSLPFLAVLLGLLLPRPPRDPGGFAAGLGATLGGQAFVAALLLRPEMEAAGASLALGLLVRLIGETTALFLGSALLLGVWSLRRPAARPRPPAATPR